MAVLSEGIWAAEAIIAQLSGFMSRDSGTLFSGNNLGAGRVLGKRTLGAATGAAVGGNTGNGTITASPTVLDGAKVGVYRAIALAATKFAIYDPTGICLGVASTGSAFTGGGLTFTITAGGTPFVAGDAFTVTVAAGDGKWGPVNLSAVDGTQTAQGVLWGPVDATSADKACVVMTRYCELNRNGLDFGSLNSGQQTTAIAQLLAAGRIVVKEAI